MLSIPHCSWNSWRFSCTVSGGSQLCYSVQWKLLILLTFTQQSLVFSQSYWRYWKLILKAFVCICSYSGEVYWWQRSCICDAKIQRTSWLCSYSCRLIHQVCIRLLQFYKYFILSPFFEGFLETKTCILVTLMKSEGEQFVSKFYVLTSLLRSFSLNLASHLLTVCIFVSVCLMK